MNTSFTQKLSYFLSCLLLLGLTGVLSAQSFEVTAPGTIAGMYNTGGSTFGPQFDDFSGEVAVVTDSAGMSTACVGVDNGVTDVTGKVALIDRGACAFTAKVLNAQAAGATAVIICNNDMDNPDDVITLGGADGCLSTTPVVMLSFNDCATIKAETGVMVSYTAPGTPDAGDDYTTAVAAGEGMFTVDTLDGTASGFSGSAAAAWYIYTPSADGVATISSCGGGANTRLLFGVAPAGCSGDFQLVNFSIDDCDDGGGNIVASTLDVLVEAGNEYVIIWDDAQSADGFDFEISLAGLPTVDLVLTVNMELETVSPDGVNLEWGTIVNGSITGIQSSSMIDNGDGTYSDTISVTSLDTIVYEFFNGNIVFGNDEDVPMECGVDYNTGTDLIRQHVVTNITTAALPPVCFSQCGNCPNVSGTFIVDMNNETVDPLGPWLAWGIPGQTIAGVAPMTDADMDGIYDVTIDDLSTAASDTLYYRFYNGDPAMMANSEDVPSACGFLSDYDPANNARAIILGGTADFALLPVCFGLCEACPPPACSNPNAIFCDDIESYVLGEVSAQSPLWEPWTGGVSSEVSNEQSASGDQSVKVDGTTGTIDQLLLLGDSTSGNYSLTWKFYIPAGNGGYYNFQKIQDDPGNEFGMQLDFTPAGTANLDATAAEIVSFDYPQDQWFDVVHYIDLDNDVIRLIIDGDVIFEWQYSATTFDPAPSIKQLGAINFFPLDASYIYYIDDVEFAELPAQPCNADAIICDGLEWYDSGSTTGGQASYWTTWSGDFGTAEDGIVSSDQAATGENSMFIGDNTIQDVLLLLGEQTEGHYQLEWNMYIPSGRSAYYNVQNEETPGVQWNLNLFMGEDDGGASTPGEGLVLETGTTFSFPEDAWFRVVHEFDLDNDVVELWVDGQFIEEAPFPDNLGSIDFFSISALSQVYYDDIMYIELPDCNEDAIICDPIEAYPVGGTSGEGADHWATWGGPVGGADDGIITDEQAASGDKSVLIAEGQTQDVLLLLGDRTDGRYSLSWDYYIPAGATGYWNIQNEEVPGQQWNLDVFFNDGGGAPGQGNVDQTGNTFTYPEDAWFSIEMVIDLDNDVLDLFVDGTQVEDGFAYPDNLGSINFFSIDATNRYYIDNVLFRSLPAVVQEVEVTMTVDMTLFQDQGNTVDAEGIHVAGSFNGFAPAPMTDNGDGTWSTTVTMDTDQQILYKFINGSAFGTVNGIDQEGTANLMDCGEDDGYGGFNRVADIGTADVDLGTVCWDNCVICDDVVGINNVVFQNGLAIFPNPAQNQATIQFNFPETLDLNVRLFNNLGQVVIESEVKGMQAGTTQLDLNNLASGMYMLQITDGDNTYTEKLVIKK